MEKQIDNLQDLIEFLIKGCNLRDEEKYEILKERNVIKQFFKLRQKMDGSQ